MGWADDTLTKEERKGVDFFLLTRHYLCRYPWTGKVSERYARIKLFGQIRDCLIRKVLA